MASNTRSRTDNNESYIDKKFAELMETLASKENIEDLKLLLVQQNDTIKKQNEEIYDLKNVVNQLHDKVAILSNSVDKLKKCSDDQEQYSRRSCLRFKGIEKEDNETSDKCVKKVLEVCKGLNANITEEVIDRAHRVGKKRDIMIVKFTSFKYRTSVYRNRKKNENIKIHLDLTKKRLNLLDQARSMITDLSAVSFVFGDINCNTVARMKDGKFKFFENMDDFIKIL